MAGLATGHYYDGPLIDRIWLPPGGGFNLLIAYCDNWVTRNTLNSVLLFSCLPSGLSLPFGKVFGAIGLDSP